MISESRDEFTKWVLDSYNSLHEELFDSLGKFKLEKMLSGEMLCYSIVKPWYKRVSDDRYILSDADIRQEVNEEQVQDVRMYLEDRDEDTRSYLVRWFLPRENEEASEVDWALIEPIAVCGFVEWMKQTQEKNPELSMGEVGDIMVQRLQSYSWDFVEEMIWYAMDFVDRLNRDGRNIPDSLRVVARTLEAREKPSEF